jgi:hypothetical protein
MTPAPETIIGGHRGRCIARAREQLMEAARRREIDIVLVWRMDRLGRSVTDLLTTPHELEHLGVGFVSLTEALDLATPAGRAMAGLLAIFLIMRSARLCKATTPKWRYGLHINDVGLRIIPAGTTK